MRTGITPLLSLLLLTACASAGAPTPNVIDGAQPSVSALSASGIPKCPANPDPKDCRGGNDGEVGWNSCAIPIAKDTAVVCLRHTVDIMTQPLSRYVNWPRAGFVRSTVNDQMSLESCCYLHPNSEPETLEHDIAFPKRIPTMVFVGSGGPGGQLSVFTRVDGYTEYDGSPLHISFTAWSSVKTGLTGQEFTYQITNQGDPFQFGWDFTEKPLLQEFATKSGLERYPLAFSSDRTEFEFASPYLGTDREIGSPIITILGPSGEPLLQLTTLAFRPAGSQ